MNKTVTGAQGHLGKPPSLRLSKAAGPPGKISSHGRGRSQSIGSLSGTAALSARSIGSSSGGARSRSSSPHVTSLSLAPKSRLSQATRESVSSVEKPQRRMSTKDWNRQRELNRRIDRKYLDMPEIKEAFDFLDSEGKGRVDRRDLKAALRALGCQVGKEQSVSLMQRHDRLETGFLSFDEFAQCMAGCLEAEAPNKIQHSFNNFDESSCGQIEVKDLQRIMRDLGESIPESDLVDMIELFDINGDGVIDVEEFAQIMELGSND